MKGIDRIILNLFYVYVFMLPFENILEVMWNIDTPYTPYRILGLLIGFLILISRKSRSLKFYKNDLKLVGLYFFGLIPSIIAWLDNRFSAETFWSTSLQYFIVLWIFLLIKNLPMGLKHIYTCMNIFCGGVLINCIYMIYSFLVIDINRQSGWMANPNFAAFANNIAFSYFYFLFYHKVGTVFNRDKMVLLVASFIVFIALFIAGSRSSLISLTLTILIIVIYRFSFKRLCLNLCVMAIPILFLSPWINMKIIYENVPVLNRLVTLADKEEARSVLWMKSLEAFKDTYFVGMGIEQFKNPENYRRYVQKTENVSVANQEGLVIHNDYLTVLVEYGILSFLCFISFYYGIYWRMKRQITFDLNLFVFEVCFWNMVLFSIFDSSFQSHSMWFVFIVLGFIAYLPPLQKQFEK